MQLPTEYNVIIGKRGRKEGGRGERKRGREGRREGGEKGSEGGREGRGRGRGRRKEEENRGGKEKGCGENGEVREALWSICRKGEGRDVGSPALWSIMEDVVCQEH